MLRERQERREAPENVAPAPPSVLARYRELWYTLAAIAAVTGLYALAYRQEGRLPGASTLVGHGIGIAGFALMLMAATLYTIRKRLTDARWGSMEASLRFHMVAGLVGPYMVFLHTSMRFWGLAGVAMLLTVVVVVSGLVGRYVYATLPRAADGPQRRLDHLAAERRAWAVWRSVHVPVTWALMVTVVVHMAGALYYELGR